MLIYKIKYVALKLKCVFDKSPVDFYHWLMIMFDFIFMKK